MNEAVVKKSIAWKKCGLATAVVAAAIAMTAQIGVAQTVPDEGLPDNGGLKLPSDITLFGNHDPSVRKATAIINGDIITDTDIDQRLALVLAANGGKIADEEREQLRLQVLRNLIDETLQIQEAKANEIVVAPEEIQQTFVRVAQNFRRKPDEFATYLAQQGSSERSIKRQIEGELAWSRLLSRRVNPFVSVGDEEVQQIIDRLEESRGQQEFRVAEIFLSSTPATQDQVLANANRIIEQIRAGGSFVAYARQYSEASTAAVGGDLGWVRAAQLPEQLSTVVTQMPTGAISAPVPLPGGFSIIAVSDSRQVLTADPRDAVLSLKQVAVEFPEGTTQTQAAPKVEQLAATAKAIRGCGGVEKEAATIGAEVVQSDNIKIRDLPGPLQEMMVKLQVGEATQPFGSLKDGVRVLVLCGRDDAKTASGPNFDQIYAQLEEEKVGRRARRYLRDLRRDAVVDYR